MMFKLKDISSKKQQLSYNKTKKQEENEVDVEALFPATSLFFNYYLIRLYLLSTYDYN